MLKRILVKAILSTRNDLLELEFDTSGYTRYMANPSYGSHPRFNPFCAS